MASIRDKIRILSQRRLISIDDFVEVVESEQISPTYQRVTLRGDCLAAYEQVCPADGFKIVLGTREDSAIRGFTVRNFDQATQTLQFDVHLHSDGVATAWVQNAKMNTRLRFLGFRRDFAIGDNVEEHVLIADASAIPAAATIVESIPAHHRVTVLAESPTRADLALLGEWPHMALQAIIGEPSSGPSSPLVAAARALTVNPGAEYWVSAESATVRAIRRHLLDSDVPRERLHATAYWIAGRTSSQRDDDEANSYRLATEAGLDVNDPNVYDFIEFESDGQPMTG